LKPVANARHLIALAIPIFRQSMLRHDTAPYHPDDRAMAESGAALTIFGKTLT
jgi:hypothetical protein